MNIRAFTAELCNFDQVAPHSFHHFLLKLTSVETIGFSVFGLVPAYMTDDFLTSCTAKSVRHIDISSGSDYGPYPVTDDAILAFLLQESVKPVIFSTSYPLSVSAEFCKRLLEVSFPRFNRRVVTKTCVAVPRGSEQYKSRSPQLARCKFGQHFHALALNVYSRFPVALLVRVVPRLARTSTAFSLEGSNFQCVQRIGLHHGSPFRRRPAVRLHRPRAVQGARIVRPKVRPSGNEWTAIGAHD